MAGLVARILDESGFEAALVCEFLGDRKLANTRKIVRLAARLRPPGRVHAGRVRRPAAGRPGERAARGAGGHDRRGKASIRLMSIHQAKGLEFPIVVLPDLNRKSNPPRALLGLQPDLGLVVRPPRTAVLPSEAEAESATGDSLGWLAYGAIEAEEDRKEAMRLFYVATTRARDHLVLSAGLDSVPDADDPAAPYLSAVGACSSQNPGNPRAHSPAMQLLCERFDWRSGGCLAHLPDGWPAPRVDVIVATPPEPEGRRRGPRRRFQEIERAITSPMVRATKSVSIPPRRPGMIDLDPDLETPSRAARLGRLIRVALVDRGLLQGEPVAEVCSRIAARQVPAASSTMQQEAIRCLEPWLDSPLFGDLRDAARGRRAIERSTRWMLPWPDDGTDATVIRGRCDLIFRDRKGFWRPVVVSTDAVQREADNLCLLLAGAAARRLGKDPGGPPWWVQAGPGAELLVEARLAQARRRSTRPSFAGSATTRPLHGRDSPLLHSRAKPFQGIEYQPVLNLVAEGE